MDRLLFALLWYTITVMSYEHHRVPNQLNYFIQQHVSTNTKENIKPLHHWPLFIHQNPLVTRGFPSQRASNMESHAMWWCRHAIVSGCWVPISEDEWPSSLGYLPYFLTKCGVACVELAPLSLDYWEDISITRLIIIIKSEVSTFPNVGIFFRGCVSEVVVPSYAVSFTYIYTYVPGKVDFASLITVQCYDVRK